MIKNYSKKDGMKQSVTVGMVGYPNVGKSSLINSLKRTRAVGVSSVPGYTKCM
jgi:nuclear GTP-binding protein